jgi:hypothetical protein
MSEIERILIIDHPHTTDFALSEYSQMYMWHYYLKGKLQSERKGGWIEGFSCGECDYNECKQNKRTQSGTQGIHNAVAIHNYIIQKEEYKR